jgi:hypothetical protein
MKERMIEGRIGDSIRDIKVKAYKVIDDKFIGEYNSISSMVRKLYVDGHNTHIPSKRLFKNKSMKSINLMSKLLNEEFYIIKSVIN